MSNPYIQKEIAKIIESNEYPQNIALASAWIIANFKGINIKIYDAQKDSSLCDYNVIASAENITQSRAMVDEIIKNLKSVGQVDVLSLEGLSTSEWILLDVGDVIIHVFQDISRDIYDLDTLWAHNPQVDIPQEYYFGAEMEVKKPEDPTDNYF